MHQRPLLLTAVLCLSVPSMAAATTYQFAGLTWNMGRKEAQQTLNRLGFRFLRQGAYGDAVYAGLWQDHPAQVTLKYGPLGRLVAVDARVLPPEGGLLAAHQALKAELMAQYGEPVYSLFSFRLPYREGDGDELEALKRNLAVVDSVWFDEHQLNVTTRSGVQLEVVHAPFSRLQLRQFYLSDAWTEEYQRREGSPEQTF